MKKKACYIALNLIIIAFCGTVIGLGIRSLAVKDGRFGWGMFSYHTVYSVEYFVIDQSDNEIPYTTYSPHGKTVSERNRKTNYGPGAVKFWIKKYMRYALVHDETLTDASNLKAYIDFTANGKEFSSTITAYE